jgi:uncharacterized protein (UPF0332 family)
MSFNKEDLIEYRLEKAWTTFEEAKSLAGSGFWDGAANRLYYGCFYAVIALFAKTDIPATTHNGVRTEFFRNYIKTGILDKKFSSLYSNLMGKRQESDYGDFRSFSEVEILPLINEVESFLHKISELIKG